MTYRAIGLMSGSSLDGLDIAFVEFVHNAGTWNYEIVAADCYEYNDEWKSRLQNATSLSALDYQLLHADYGHYIGKEILRFIDEMGLHFKVGLIASHGHTTFHVPRKKMTAQLGDGAAIAAETGLPVVSDLRALDVAFGGQGAPIVPIGEKLLLKEYDMYLNLGGIANISFNNPDNYLAFDICPANRVLNMIAAKDGKEYDAGGQMAAMGNAHEGLLQKLNDLFYYQQPYPKSLANNFGVEEVYPLIRSFGLTHFDELRTCVEHVVQQIKLAISNWQLAKGNDPKPQTPNPKLLVTGGGAFNTFLMKRLTEELNKLSVEVIVPDENLVQYKEALIMAFIGVLRWRQEYNVLSSVTGAERDSIGGAVWIGQEA
ncbi:MAG: anhydro-N-acetylmuramic acid kinase [Flavisolibacter sp.]|jgi:anhydro-N-acetylmuramic acid kinase|nr:anhydro-N-acetylmuramic acid kinase [Flavisolibacter sp.]